MDPLRRLGHGASKLARAHKRDAPEPAPRAPTAAASRDIDAEVALILASQLFDADWYRLGTGQSTADVAQLVRHYVESVGPGRRTANPLFDLAFYEARHGHELAGVDPLVHYVREGWRRGYDPHPLIDVSFYIERYGDIRMTGIEPLFHYTVYGWRERRVPCPEFDVAYYLEKNDDVRESDVEPLRHYLEHGAAEGRDPSAAFDTLWYARHVLKGEATNPLVHFRTGGSNPDILTRQLSLDARYAMSQADFELWMRTFRREGGPDRSTQGQVVRVDGGSSGEVSLAAARYESGAPGVSRRAYLVCDPRDEVDAALLPHLSRMMERAELAVFDFAFRRGAMVTPVLLPGANAVQLEAVDATFSRFAIADRLLARVEAKADAAPRDILEAAIARLRAEGRLDLFAHLPAPLLRTEDLSGPLEIQRRRLARDAHLGALGSTARADRPSVSVVICSKDRCRLLSQLLDSLLAFPVFVVRDIVVVTNADADGFAADVHAHYAGEGRVTLVRHRGPYNFSRQSNRGAAHCSGDLLLFLNDDIVPIVPHWLDALRAPFARPEVGVAGPLLFYADESVQHAGMYLGFNGVAGHTLRGTRLPEADYMLEASAPRNVSTVTGAALLTRRALFEDLNGFDRQLGTYLQDVDYCLRVRNCDREIVYEPRSFLFHMESVSMREHANASVFGDRRPLEHRHFLRKWKDALAGDPFHNPNFDVQDESLRTLAHCPLELQ